MAGKRLINYVQVLENNEGRAVKQTEDIYLIRSGEKIIGAVEFADYDEEKDLVAPKRDGQIENLLNDDYATAENMIGECEAVAELKKKIQKIKDADSPVLIMVETGTGKELTCPYYPQFKCKEQKTRMSMLTAVLAGKSFGRYSFRH